MVDEDVEEHIRVGWGSNQTHDMCWVFDAMWQANGQYMFVAIEGHLQYPTVLQCHLTMLACYFPSVTL